MNTGARVDGCAGADYRRRQQRWPPPPAAMLAGAASRAYRFHTRQCHGHWSKMTPIAILGIIHQRCFDAASRTSPLSFPHGFVAPRLLCLYFMPFMLISTSQSRQQRAIISLMRCTCHRPFFRRTITPAGRFRYYCHSHKILPEMHPDSHII